MTGQTAQMALALFSVASSGLSIEGKKRVFG